MLIGGRDFSRASTSGGRSRSSAGWMSTVPPVSVAPVSTQPVAQLALRRSGSLLRLRDHRPQQGRLAREHFLLDPAPAIVVSPKRPTNAAWVHANFLSVERCHPAS